MQMAAMVMLQDAEALGAVEPSTQAVMLRDHWRAPATTPVHDVLGSTDEVCPSLAFASALVFKTLLSC
jgi:hypothetical protein